MCVRRYAVRYCNFIEPLCISFDLKKKKRKTCVFVCVAGTYVIIQLSCLYNVYQSVHLRNFFIIHLTIERCEHARNSHAVK